MGYSPHLPEHGSGDTDTAGSNGRAGPSPADEMQLTPTPERKSGYVIYINGSAIGDGDHPQGRNLIQDFLYTLTEIAPQPKAIVLVGSAARLACAGSAALEILSLMQEQGVRILIAEKSIEEIEGEAEIAVGDPATMHAILNTLLQAEKVITL